MGSLSIVVNLATSKKQNQRKKEKSLKFVLEFMSMLVSRQSFGHKKIADKLLGWAGLAKGQVKRVKEKSKSECLNNARYRSFRKYASYVCVCACVYTVDVFICISLMRFFLFLSSHL